MKRVVITGMGIFSPIGNTLADVHTALTTRKSGVRAMPEWQQHTGLKSWVAGRVDGAEPALIPRTYRRTMGRMAILAALAARDAVAQAGLSPEVLASKGTGVAFGSTTGASYAMQEFFGIFIKTNGFQGLEGTLFPKVMSHTVAANVAAYLGIRGRLLALSSACASSTQTIGAAFETIRAGQQQVMICGGADDLHPASAAVFDVLAAASRKYNDTPQATPRPFDRDRDGLALGEGAGALVLEDYDHAVGRGAVIHGEILGYATCCNAHHMTQPDAESMLDCMRLALDSAGRRAADLQYINAHATGTLMGDAAEADAIRQLVGPDVPVSGTKGYTGHTLAACGAMETIFCTLMMKHSFIAPTLNLDAVAADCQGLQHVQEQRSAPVGVALNSNFAFGGVSAALVLGKT